jgi:hypothetical protein
MNAFNLQKRLLLPPRGGVVELRPTNCVSLRRSNPNLRLGPGQRTSLPDEREESIERQLAVARFNAQLHIHRRSVGVLPPKGCSP